MADLKDDDEDIAEELAMERLAEQGAGSNVASSFLAAKTEVLRKQLSQLHVSHFREWLYASAETVLGLVILLIFVGITSAVWSAAHDNGLVIESFSVPADMANRGLTGQVVASRLLDRLAFLQAQTGSSRAASSYANDWGKDITVQIPDTGVSIGQLNDYLRQWLGNETHISGEVYRDADGNVALAARVGGYASQTFSGKETDLDKLLQKAAESVYQRTQPYRYAVYLNNQGRNGEAEAAYRALIASGSPQDRAWAYIGLSTIYQNRDQLPQSLHLLYKALEVRPNFVMANQNISTQETQLQHDELAYAWDRKTIAGLRQGDASDMDSRAAALAAPIARSSAASVIGDFQEQLNANRQAEALSDFGGQIENIRANDVFALAFLHDWHGVQAASADLSPPSNFNALINRDANLLTVYYLFGRWKEFFAIRDTLNAATAKFGLAANVFKSRVLEPLTASAMAETGDFKGADALIARSAMDCDLCLRARARIAATEHRWGAVDHWLAIVSARAPSIPLADSDWGFALLARGDADGALVKFKSAHGKSPHYADPLEGWGEALMAKKRSDLALAEFEDANRYAPNWGRLHLKWGEALLYSGDKDDAKKQFAIAAKLDLSGAEKSELTQVSRN